MFILAKSLPPSCAVVDDIPSIIIPIVTPICVCGGDFETVNLLVPLIGRFSSLPSFTHTGEPFSLTHTHTTPQVL